MPPFKCACQPIPAMKQRDDRKTAERFGRSSQVIFHFVKSRVICLLRADATIPIVGLTKEQCFVAVFDVSPIC
jgi:hypothetical protein